MSKTKKSQYNIKLFGCKPNGIVAKTHESELVTKFTDAGKRFIIKAQKDGSISLQTARNTYVLNPHGTIKNKWLSVCDGIKVHFNKKKVVASLVYWA